MSAEIVTNLQNFINDITQITILAKDNKDYSTLLNSATASLDTLTGALNLVNPANWPEATVKEYLHEYLTALVEFVKIRVKRDWRAAVDQEELLANLFLKGPIILGPLKDMPSFATVFANGIVNQFPIKFPRSVNV